MGEILDGPTSGLQVPNAMVDFCACVFSVCKKRSQLESGGAGGAGGAGAGLMSGGILGLGKNITMLGGGDKTTMLMACSLAVVVAFCVGYKLGGKMSKKDK